MTVKIHALQVQPTPLDPADLAKWNSYWSGPETEPGRCWLPGWEEAYWPGDDDDLELDQVLQAHRKGPPTYAFKVVGLIREGARTLVAVEPA